MINLRVIRICIIQILLFSTILLATDYYISSSAGNDSNSGTSSSSPWKSISKLNSRSFSPGDRIFFKRGDKWSGTALSIKNSGTSAARITFGAYGEGEKPVITLRTAVPGWNNSANWTRVEPNTWVMSFPGTSTSRRVSRVWLGGTEYPAAIWWTKGSLNTQSESQGTVYQGDNLNNLAGIPKTYGVNSLHRFFHDRASGKLYVYTDGTNPASFYSSMEYPGVVLPDGNIVSVTVELLDADYITLENLDLQGGMLTSLALRGADYAIIQNCNISKYANEIGVSTAAGVPADKTSEYGIIRDCIIDSDYKVKFHWHKGTYNVITFGIYFYDGTSYWKAYNNKVSRWANCLVSLNGSRPSMYNEFFSNEVFSPELTYSKGGQINGNSTQSRTFAKYYNNYFHHLTSGINVCGSDVTIQYNIFEDIRWTENDHATSKNSGYGIEIVGGGTGSVVDNNTISNNLFNNLYGWALLFAPNNVWFENNLMVNCRTKYPTKYYIQVDNGSKLRVNNNIFFENSTTAGSDFVAFTSSSTKYSISELNNLSETSSSETNKNIHFTGSLSSLINTAGFALPSGSPAINAGINRTWMQKADYNGSVINDLRDIGAVEYSGTTQGSAPSITSSPVLNALVGQSYSYDVNASGSPTPVYSLNTAPSGMTINSSTGLISWKPATAGSYSVTVQASNGVSPNDVQNFTIKVTEPAITNSAPVITSAPVNSAIAGQTYSYDVNATGSPAPTFSLSSAPGGMTINSTSGLIQWTPVSAGSYSVSVIAANGVLPNSVQTYTIQVIQQTESITPSGLISYWKMDETSGSTYKDEVGTLNASAVVLPTPVAGKVSGAQLFNGSTTRINVPVSKTYDFPTGSSFSISLWMKSTFVSSTSKPIIGRFSSADNFRWFLGTVNGKAYMYMSSAGRSAGLTGKTTVSNGSWNYLTVTRNSSGTVKLYINGVLEASTVFTGSFTSATAQLNIGWYSFQTNYYNGALDETAIFNKELSADEIQQYYNNSLSGKGYINNTQFITANAKVFLEGPYAAGVMNTNLKSGNVIPLAQPYNGSPWNYSGMERVTTVPVDVVDWILVEVRSGVSSSTVVNKRAAFLKKDGSIVDLDGSSDVKFSGVPAGNYYIVLTHRNHLEIMSAAPVSLSSSSLLYDFTLSASKSYGANSMINLGDGRYGMISGDGDSNGIINILDYGTVSRSINETGYLQGDLDMNKVVDIQDYEKSGSTLFYTSKVPQ